MNQENTAESSAAFEPRSLFGDAARPEPAETTHAEPAGRQDERAAPEPVGELGDSVQTPPEGQDGRARDAAGRFAPKPEAAPDATGSPPAPQQQEPPPQHVPVAVHVAERKKHQAEIAALQARLAQSQPMPQPQQAQQPARQPIQPPPADLMFSDPDRYHAGMVQYQHHVAASMQAEMDRRQLAMASTFARRQWADYDDALKELMDAASANPTFGQAFDAELARSNDPAGLAYQRGKDLLAQKQWQPIQQQYGNPQAFIDAEVERRLAAERGQSMPAASSRTVTPPPASLASARSVGPRGDANTFTGPRPLFPSGRRA